MLKEIITEIGDAIDEAINAIALAHWKKEYNDYIDIDPSNQAMTEERHHLEGIIQKFGEGYINT